MICIKIAFLNKKRNVSLIRLIGKETWTHISHLSLSLIFILWLSWFFSDTGMILLYMYRSPECREFDFISRISSYMPRAKKTGTHARSRRYLCNHTQRVSALSSGMASRTVSNRPTLNHSFVPCDAPPAALWFLCRLPHISRLISRDAGQYRRSVGRQNTIGRDLFFSRTIYRISR